MGTEALSFDGQGAHHELAPKLWEAGTLGSNAAPQLEVYLRREMVNDHIKMSLFLEKNSFKKNTTHWS